MPITPEPGSILQADSHPSGADHRREKRGDPTMFNAANSATLLVPMLVVVALTYLGTSKNPSPIGA